MTEPTMPEPTMSGPTISGEPIGARIARTQEALSPQERRAAATLLAHLDDLATYRAAELAGLAGVSKATMSRLFRSLGFADFDEVRAHLRSLRTAGLPVRVGDDPGLAAQATFDADAIARVLVQDGLARAVDLLAGARRVLVLGWRSSHPVALHLRQQLAQVRAGVGLAPLPGQVLGEELAALGRGDVVVAIGFRRRPPVFRPVLAEAVATGADVVLVADPSAADLAPRVAVWLECAVQGPLAFDSLAAAMSLVSALADGVLAAAGITGRERAASVSALYERLAEVE